MPASGNIVARMTWWQQEVCVEIAGSDESRMLSSSREECSSDDILLYPSAHLSEASLAPLFPANRDITKSPITAPGPRRQNDSFYYSSSTVAPTALPGNFT
ncbi:hypothetical protein JZ751_012045 [Albula glossodonta]|uniref:Uncharacterized protein n=1 Tax=Albula glossodonta TaxID=121402 RepID=A0A8T2PRK3_9TELE|nr:hypothetical protein JZ751_012045 [Albula glossodonta]